VFIPRGLQYGDQTVYTILTLELRGAAIPEGSPSILVKAATHDFNVSFFRAALLLNNTTIAQLGPGLSGGSAILSFVDDNADHLLNAGDFFPLRTISDGRYRFEVYQGSLDRIVGILLWTGRV